MKACSKLITTIALVLSASVAQASAFDDVATITSVTPIFTEQMQQQQVCSGPVMQMADNRSNAGAVIGGIAGALLGSRIGNGNGRLAATAAGAALGSISGDRVDNRQAISSDQQSCHWEQVRGTSRVTAYMVSYEYQGRTFQTPMPYNPQQNGTNSMRVSIMVTPR